MDRGEAAKMPRQLLPKAESETPMSPTAMDSIPLAGTEGKAAKRRCISSACMPCRKRKSKVSLNPLCMGRRGLRALMFVT